MAPVHAYLANSLFKLPLPATYEIAPMSAKSTNFVVVAEMTTNVTLAMIPPVIVAIRRIGFLVTAPFGVPVSATHGNVPIAVLNAAAAAVTKVVTASVDNQKPSGASKTINPKSIQKFA